MTADKNAKVANMFRFGMQLPMPRSFETIEYYGRGPMENYIDRKYCADPGHSIAKAYRNNSIRISALKKTVLKQMSAGGRCWMPLVMELK